MNETSSSIAAVHELAWSVTPLPECAEHHASGHHCVTFFDNADPAGVLEAVADWYGQPLALAARRSFLG